MAKTKKKRQFHCSTCGNPCEIYKKGKKHRVLVCPKCGILATNPIPMLGALAGALAPKALKAVGGLLGGEKEKKEQPIIIKETYSTEERVRDALR